MKRRTNILTFLLKDKYLDLSIEKTVEQESNVYTSCNRCFWYSHQRINKGTGGLSKKRTNRDHQKYFIIEMGRDLET